MRCEGKVERGVGRVRKGGGGVSLIAAAVAAVVGIEEAEAAETGLEVDEAVPTWVLSEAGGKMFLYMDTVAKDCSRKISM